MLDRFWAEFGEFWGIFKGCEIRQFNKVFISMLAVFLLHITPGYTGKNKNAVWAVQTEKLGF